MLNIPGVGLSHEIDQTLDEVYSTLISSFTWTTRALCFAIARRLGLKGIKRHCTFQPLLSFWTGLTISRDPDKSVLPLFERLKQNACAPEALCRILEMICSRSWDPLPVVWQRTIDVLIAHPNRGSRAAFAMYLPETLEYDNRNMFHYITSFLSNDNSGEEHIDVVGRIEQP